MIKGLFIVLSLFALTPSAQAESYPTRPIRLLVGFPPGGPVDITARLAAQYLGEALGQQFVVDNRPGAGGSVSGALLSNAAPDGYTLSVGANGGIAISPSLRPYLPFKPLKDFMPISCIGLSQLALVVNPRLEAKSVGELVALAKARPGVRNFASSGTGSTAHLAAELFKSMSGIDIVHVPYKGAAPALSELMAGQVQMLITGYSSTVPHLKAGRLRALGVTGPQRMKAAPEIPTIGETVKGYDVNSWYGLFAPRATPQPIIDRLHREVAAMTRRREVIDRLTALGIDALGDTPAEFTARIKRDTEKWAKVIKAANIRVR
jgi:tripartite-type tricarboxylate transporter receptor subunit TctC